MDYTVLGRTGLKVSVAAIGCGGQSRLGQTYGNTIEQSVDVIRAAMDLGTNFIDTAAAYGTEEIVGRAIQGVRDKVIVSTKTMVFSQPDGPDSKPYTGAQILEQLELNLSRLGTDYIDVYHLHAIRAKQLDHVNSEIVPALIKAREQGKIRFLGITEAFGNGDAAHKMLPLALKNDVWDVVMVGFSMLNPSARSRVIAPARAKNVGVLAMFAVRRSLSDENALKAVLKSAAAAGQLDLAKFDLDDPLGFLRSNGGAISTTDAAYRFCRHEPGIHVVLTGTGKIEHLKKNIASINRGPLPADMLVRLEDLFGAVDSISGN